MLQKVLLAQRGQILYSNMCAPEMGFFLIMGFFSIIRMNIILIITFGAFFLSLLWPLFSVWCNLPQLHFASRRVFLRAPVRRITALSLNVSVVVPDSGSYVVSADEVRCVLSCAGCFFLYTRCVIYFYLFIFIYYIIYFIFIFIYFHESFLLPPSGNRNSASCVPQHR